MNSFFVGRENEQQIMQEALRSGKPEMVAVVGRRRVGKTYLINHAYRGRIVFEATGIQNGPSSEQLQNFAFRVNWTFYAGKAKLKPKNWLEAFQLLIVALEEQQYQDKFVIFLDELPWFDARKSGFVRALGFFWNSWCIHQKVVVVICGSAASWMVEQVVNDRGGLHNRITRKIDLLPFNLRETEQYLKADNIHLERYQIILLYMVLGGIPHYLNEVRAGQSALEQIGRICSPPSILSGEFNNLYPALFDNPTQHIAVIMALSEKKIGMDRAELVKIAKLTDGGGVSQVLQELQFSGFISTYFPFGTAKRKILYRLTDEFSLFHLSFLAQQTWIDAEGWLAQSQTPAFRTWCGYAFENLCLKHIGQIKRALGIAGVYTEASAFSFKGNADEQGFQIDLVLDRKDQCIHLFEFKFHNVEFIIDKAYATQLRERRAAFKRLTKTNKHIFISFLTNYGVKTNEHSIGLVDHNLDMDVLFT
jgi:uncharacterized protein